MREKFISTYIFTEPYLLSMELFCANMLSFGSFQQEMRIILAEHATPDCISWVLRIICAEHALPDVWGSISGWTQKKVLWLDFKGPTTQLCEKTMIGLTRNGCITRLKRSECQDLNCKENSEQVAVMRPIKNCEADFICTTIRTLHYIVYYLRVSMGVQKPTHSQALQAGNFIISAAPKST